MYKSIFIKLKGLILNPESIKNWQIFIVLMIINIILSWIFQEYVMTREVYHSLFSERIESYRIDRQLELANRFQIWGYLLIPALLWLKITLVTLLLQLPLLYKFIEIPFKSIFRVVMIASFSFILMSMVRMIQLASIPPEQINDNILKSMPLSFSGLIDISNYPESAVVMLSTFNIFEAVWMLFLFLGFSIIAEDKIKKIDSALLVFGVWSFLLFIQYVFVTYMEKVFYV